MAHIPRRATQHGLFEPSHDTPLVALKPGQADLRDSAIFDEEAKPPREVYLTQDQTRESVYASTIGVMTLPEDYASPVKPIRPPRSVVGATGAGIASSGTAHWVSEYRATSQTEPPEVPLRSPGRWINRLDGFGRSGEPSSYAQEYGRYGSDPREKLPAGATKLPVFRQSLNFGTTKGTHFMPGYQGFIPSHQRHSNAMEPPPEGSEPRSIDKANLHETYHVNLVGYAGHTPQSARNDFGGRRSSDETVYGKDYAPPRSWR
eukprot:CAMPEP_0117530044 /NCGR_PEP_ID=MMETSP0784-20121206/38140_1 /TAXON_ID=39447 /ORGANISM="" /LENGTH=260 /DNA_ID=CAMNT_0005326375 /DNA_START=30 /DNA_END=812 /DNA_ORIENTATION=+